MGSEIPRRSAQENTSVPTTYPAEVLAAKLVPLNARAVIQVLPNGARIAAAWANNGHAYIDDAIARQLSHSQRDIFLHQPKSIKQAPQLHDTFREPKTGAVWRVFEDIQSGQQHLQLMRSAQEQNPSKSGILPGQQRIAWKPNYSQGILERHERNRRISRRKNIAAAVVGTVCLGSLAYESVISPESPSPFTLARTILNPAQIRSPKKTPSAPTSTPPPESTSPTPKENTIKLKVGTANLLVDNSASKVNTTINILFNTNGNDIVGLQEAGPFTKKVLAKIACESETTACDKPETMFPGVNGGSATKNQIVWRTDRFDYIDGKTNHVASDPDVNGGHFRHKRYANWVRLKDKQTGQEMYFIDMHAPNAIETHGVPNKKHKGSVKAYGEMMHNVVKMIKEFQKDGLPILLVGDTNVDFRSDNAKCTTVIFPCRSIDPLMEDVWILADINGQNGTLSTQGKSGNRLIDRIFFSETNTFKMTVIKAYVNTETGKMTGGNEGSDHKPFNGDFQIQILNKQTGQKSVKSFSLTLDGVNNFRDAGASSNGSMNKGVLYRSARPENATKEDIDKLASLLGEGGTIIDLRTKDVRAKEPDPEVPGVKNVSLPVAGASSADSYIKEFVQSPDGRASFGAALRLIADSDKPVLVHCEAGKDRTGWLTLTIQYINGIEYNKAADKADLQNPKMTEGDRTKAKAAREEALVNQIRREYRRSNQAWGSKSISIAWIDAAIEEIVKEYGSFENYVKDGLGISAEEIQKINQKI